MTVARYFETMDYGPAPEADTEARAWLKRHGRASGISSAAGSVKPASGAVFRSRSSRRPGHAGAGRAGRRGGRGRGGGGGAQGAGTVVEARRAGAGAASLCARAAWCSGTARLLAVLEALDNGKPIRETARSRYAAGGAALLSSRRLGAAAGARVARPAAGRRRRPDHSLELPAADAGLEGGAGAGARQHGGAEAGGVHARSRRCCSPSWRRRPGCRRACSTS